MIIALESLTKLIDLSQILYPVYKIGGVQPETIDGCTFFYSVSSSIDGDISESIRVLDDKKAPGDTLAKRRLYLLNIGNIKLKPLRIAIFFLGDLVKIAKPTTWFIDSAGTLFNYKKTKLVKLTIKRITKVMPIDGGGAILELEGIPIRFKILYKPSMQERYAGVLVDNHKYILYGLYDRKYDDSRRKI